LFYNTFIFSDIKVILAKRYLILDIKLANINIVEDKANINLAIIDIIKGKAKAKASNTNALFEDNKVIFAKVRLVSNNVSEDKAKFKLVSINIAEDSKRY